MDGWVRHRATIMAASETVPAAELRTPPVVVTGTSPPLPGLSRISAKVRHIRHKSGVVDRYTWHPYDAGTEQAGF